MIRNQFGESLKVLFDYGLNAQIPIGGREKGILNSSTSPNQLKVSKYTLSTNHDVDTYLTEGVGVKFHIKDYQLIFRSSLNYGIFCFDIGTMETFRNHFLNVSLGVRKE